MPNKDQEQAYLWGLILSVIINLSMYCYDQYQIESLRDEIETLEIENSLYKEALNQSFKRY